MKTFSLTSSQEKVKSPRLTPDEGYRNHAAVALRLYLQSLLLQKLASAQLERGLAKPGWLARAQTHFDADLTLGFLGPEPGRGR